MAEKRENSFEILRAIACISVVTLHISAVYLRDDVIQMNTRAGYNIAYFFRIISNLGVPTFAMLSGAFNIKKENMCSSFYKKIEKKIFLPTIAFSMIYVIFDYMKIVFATIMGIGISVEKINYFTPLVKLVEGEPGVIMWYMFMMIPMYIITPMLCSIKNNLSQKQWMYLGGNAAI